MKFQNCLKPIAFVVDTEFLCTECENTVHSDKPETGKFFSQFGHPWIPQVGNKLGRVSDDYVQIIFAFCTKCLTKGIESNNESNQDD